MNFLGFSIETFLTVPTTRKPFGTGPWPCLNFACKQYRKRTIRKCQITYGKHRDGQPTGIFACSCGFTYSRKGPDTSDDDHYRIGKLIAFGHIWENELRRLWHDPTVSLRESARRLGVDPMTVKFQARRLGLDCPIEKGDNVTNKEPSSSNLQSQYRERWLAGMNDMPGDGITALRQKMPAVFMWLYKNDQEWLKTHRPVRQKPGKSAPRVDWKKRDAEIAR